MDHGPQVMASMVKKHRAPLLGHCYHAFFDAVLGDTAEEVGEEEVLAEAEETSQRVGISLDDQPPPYHHCVLLYVFLSTCTHAHICSEMHCPTLLALV